MKYLAWTPRATQQLDRHDRQVRLSALERGIEIDAQYPVEGWASGSARIGGEVAVSSEQFPGSSPVWIWEA